MQTLLKRYNDLSGRITSLKSDIKLKENRINEKNNLVDNLNKASWVLTEVQKKTQERFKEKIEGLVSLAIKSVYDRPFGFELVFERKRDKMEIKPLIYEIVNGQKEYYEDAENELGGGIVDICSFSLRVVLWTMETPRSRNVFILDEPGKNLGALLPLFGQMLREVSHKLNFQLIIITHDDALAEMADRVFVVTHDGRESHVSLMADKKEEKNICFDEAKEISEETWKKLDKEIPIVSEEVISKVSTKRRKRQ
jgi:DNA repair exonuclease SbcCD ATPase subunit